MPPLSLDPPTKATPLSADTATDGEDFPTAPVLTSFSPWAQTAPLRVNTVAVPTSPSPAKPPTIATLPSADQATDMPCRAVPTAPLLTSFSPCCVQPPSLRINTHAAPAGPRPKGTDRSHGLSLGPPMSAVLPSADSASDMPWLAAPTAPEPTSFLPCCDQIPRLRVNTHAAPVLSWSDQPPTIAVLPSADSATEAPWRAIPMAPEPTSCLPCCDQTPRLRVNTHAPSARQPPTIAVSPSADSATDVPWPSGRPESLTRPALVPTSFSPCCSQALPLRTNTQAAPVVLLSLGPPTIAVLPSAASATAAPWENNPPPGASVVPTSLPPCCAHTPPRRMNIHAAPAGPIEGERSRSTLFGPGPPTIAVLPSADSATDMP